MALDKIEYHADNLFATKQTNNSAVAVGAHPLAINGNVNNNVSFINIFLNATPQSMPDQSAADFKLNRIIHKDIDCVKELLNAGQPEDALKEILKIEQRYDDALKDPDAKRRLLQNKGTALILLNRPLEGANSYLDGYYCSPENELSNALRIKAYFIKKDIAGLKKAISEVPEIHHTSRIVAGRILEAIQLDVKNFPSMPSEINEVCFDDVANCLIASKFYSVRGDEINATKFFNQAKDINPDDWQVLAWEGTRHMGDEPQKQPINEIRSAKDLLEKAWNLIKNQTNVPFADLLYVPINLASAYRLLNMQKEEHDLVDNLYLRLPEDPDVLLKKILNTNDCAEAAQLSDKLDVNKGFYYAVMAALSYINNKQYEKALNVLQKVPHDENYDKLEIDLRTCICYKELNNFTAIDGIIKKQKSVATKKLFTHIKTGNKQDLIEARRFLRPTDCVCIKIEIATRLYYAGLYTEVSPLYKEIIKTVGLHDVVLSHYLDCLNRTADVSGMYKVLSSIPNEYINNTILQYWAVYHEAIGDNEKATLFFKKVFDQQPENSRAALKLAIMYHRDDNEEALSKLLNNLPSNLNKMFGDIKAKWQLLRLMYEHKFAMETLPQKAYELIIENLDDEESWKNYFTWFMTCLADFKIVNNKTGFILYDEATNTNEIYIIEDDPNIKTNKFFNVLRSSDVFTKKLMMAEENSNIQLGQNGIECKVININNKYVTVGSIIRDQIFIQFPDCDIIRIDGKTPEEAVEKLKRLFNFQNQTQDLIKNYYKEKYLPISTLANMLGKDVISLMEFLATEKLIVSEGSVVEQKDTQKLVNKQAGYIIDAITIFNAFWFHVETMLANVVKDNLYVSQKTIDIFKSLKEEEMRFLKMRSGRLFKTNSEDQKLTFASHEDLKDYQKNKIKMLDDILTWLGENAKIIIPSGASKLSDNKEQLLSFFQEKDLETASVIRLAKDKELNLLSDDYMLRAMAKKQFEINGLWLQGLFMYSPFANSNEYVEYIVNSIKNNHSFISFNSANLFKIFIKGGPDIKTLVNQMRACSSESAIIVATDFYIKLIASEKNTPQIALMLIDAVLDSGKHVEYNIRLMGMEEIAKHDAIFDRALHDWCVGHFLPYPQD